MRQFDKVSAVFSPSRTDDLGLGVTEWIGRRMEFQASYVLTEEDTADYVGQWAMTVYRRPGDATEYPFAWVPLCDLAAIEPIT